MGIQGLTKLLGEHAPQCSREQKFDGYFGRRVAVDASMHIYQFMVVVGRQGEQQLTDESGEVTSHLQGMFYRTVRMLEAGIRPLYVFEGKPPALKTQQLAMRGERRADATADLEKAKEAGDAEAVEKYAKRTVKVTRQHNEECKRLLRLMGVPVMDAPGEAEAQCAWLCREGLVYGVATEDMDTLTFGAPRVIRHLMAPSSREKEQPVTEFDRAAALSALGLTDEAFTDLCILMGCDYAPKIGGVGPVRALELIRKHGSIARALEHVDKSKVPEGYPYEEAARLFREPDVVKGEAVPQFKWVSPDEGGLVDFLVKEKGFNEERVRAAVARINRAKGKASQGRLESFFGAVTRKPSDSLAAKRESEAAAAKKKGGGGQKAGFGAKGGIKKAPLMKKK
jgi:flap endonuclease-1